MPSQNDSQKKSLTKFLDLVTQGLSSDQFLLDSIKKIQEVNGAVFIVACPKAPELTDDLKEALVDRIRELPEEFGLIFSAEAQQNDVGDRTTLFIKLTPKEPRGGR